ncbi:MAG: phosphotransferase, partial [Nocardioides sp.]
MKPDARARAPADLDQLVLHACQQMGIPARRLRQLRHFANAVYLVEDVPVVARVSYGSGSIDRARTSITIARWLVNEGFPATEPASLGKSGQPLVSVEPDDVAVTFWRYYPQPIQQLKWDPATLARLTRQLHDLTSRPPILLDDFAPLRSVRRAARNSLANRAFDTDSLRWLCERIDKLRHDYDNLQFPLGTGLIHGDAYTGNLLLAKDESAVLGDWDSV